jgi:hypothetical protein
MSEQATLPIGTSPARVPENPARQRQTKQSNNIVQSEKSVMPEMSRRALGAGAMTVVTAQLGMASFAPAKA